MEQIKGDEDEAACPVTVVGHESKVEGIDKLLNAGISNTLRIRVSLVVEIVDEF